MIEKESGGGDIEHIKEHDGVFYIHFEDPMCEYEQPKTNIHTSPYRNHKAKRLDKLQISINSSVMFS